MLFFCYFHVIIKEKETLSLCNFISGYFCGSLFVIWEWMVLLFMDINVLLIGSN